MTIEVVLAGSVASQILSGGKALISKLTDSVELVVCPGLLVVFSVLKEEEEPLRLSLTIPFKIWNKSNFQDGFIRNISLEMYGFGEGNDAYTPLDGIIEMVGTYLVSSVEYVKNEACLSAKFLRDNDQNILNDLRLCRSTNRTTLESLHINSNSKITEFFIEFRCPLGENYKEKLKKLVGKFKIIVSGEVLFSNTLTEKQIKLAEFTIKSDFDIIENNYSINYRADIPCKSWLDLNPASETLKSDPQNI